MRMRTKRLAVIRTFAKGISSNAQPVGEILT